MYYDRENVIAREKIISLATLSSGGFSRACADLTTNFRKDAAIFGQVSREASTIPEESGDAIDAASDLLERVKQKPSNKVIKT